MTDYAALEETAKKIREIARESGVSVIYATQYGAPEDKSERLVFELFWEGERKRNPHLKPALKYNDGSYEFMEVALAWRVWKAAKFNKVLNEDSNGSA